MHELPGGPTPSPRQEPGRGARLDSWKEIAAYLNRDLRTLQRWEKTANLPIRRLNKPGTRAVFAYTGELDEWLLRQSPEPAAPEPHSESTSGGQTPTRRRYGAGLAVLGAIVVLAAALALRPRSPAALGPFTIRPITSEPGNERDPDVSPDGKYVAYVHQAPSLRTRLLVRLIGGGPPHEITPGTVDEWSPTWSPDGAAIAFLRGDPAATATLVLTSALGGNERTLATVRPYARRRTLLIGHLTAWTPDGRHIVVADQHTPGRGSLVLIATDTGARTTLTTPGDAQFDVEPSLSADGTLLLFNRVRGEFLSDVFLQRLDASYLPIGQPTKLPSPGTWNGTPRLLEDRGEVLTSSGPLPRLSLWRQPLDGSSPPVSLGVIGDNAIQSAIDRANHRIIARTFRSMADVLRFSIPAKAGPEAEPAVETFLESTFIDRTPAYSPDGSQVAFISDRSGRRQLWVAEASGAEPVEWTQPFEADLSAPSWSPDGTRIAFAGIGPAGTSQLFVAGTTTRTATAVTSDTLDYVRPAWTPDGTHLYAAASDRSVYSIYRVPVNGGPAEKILPGYMNVIDVAPDGRGLYAVRRTASPVAALDYVPLPAGPPAHLAAMNFRDDAWMTRDGLYYLARTSDEPLAPVTLMFRAHTGAVSIRQPYARPPGRGLSVSPDGRQALTTRYDLPISDLLLLQPAR